MSDTTQTTERAEWWTCIASPSTGRSLCGGNHKLYMFTGLDHAYLNAVQDGRLVACPECVAIIPIALKVDGDTDEH